MRALRSAILFLSLVGCGGNAAVATNSLPAPANGALIATETTCAGFHARFALVPDASVTDGAPGNPVVRGVRWTMAVTPLAGASIAPTLTMESFTVHAMAGEHRFLGSFPPQGASAPWRWSGTVGIAPLPGGFRRGDFVNLFPSFSAGASRLAVAWLGMTLVPHDGGVVAEGAHIVKPTSCPPP